MDFLAELKRRNIFKVSMAYVALGWLVIQVTDIVVPALNLPSLIKSIVVYIGIIGFPFAVFLAWAYELTPTGVKRTKDVDTQESIRTTSGQKLNYAIIAFLTLAVIFLLLDRTPSSKDITGVGQSIAVLPFADMSEKKDQEYFSDGLSEELLNVLAKIPELKVAGRTSSFAYKGNNRDLREIGSALGVNHILEGSLRKQNNRLRITAQLIRAEDGFHIWSETYDRELSDIFLVQEEIAMSIVSNMALSIDIGLNADLISTRTENMQAYDLYLTGKSLVAKRGTENISKALTLLEYATEIAPNYATAWAMLAQAHALAHYHPGIETPQQAMALGEKAARHALSIDPTSSIAYGALGDILKDQYHWQEAEENYMLAIKFDPNNIEAISQYGQLLWRTNKIYKALPYLAKARQLDPLVPVYTQLEAMNRYAIGEKQKGLELFNRSLELSKNTSQFPPATRFLYGVLVDDVADSQRYLRLVQVHNKINPAVFFNDTLIDKMTDEQALKEYLETTRDYYMENPEKLAVENDFASLVYASIAAQHGEDQLALDFLEIEAKQGINNVNHVGLSNYLIDAFDSIQNDPRFKQIKIEYGLLDYWIKSGWPKICQPLGDSDFNCMVE